jgi:hypothetical protein
MSHQQTFSQKALKFSIDKLSGQKLWDWGSGIDTTGKSYIGSVLLSFDFNIKSTSGLFCNYAKTCKVCFMNDCVLIAHKSHVSCIIKLSLK